MIKMPKIELNNFLAQRYYFAAQANKLHHVKEGLAGANPGRAIAITGRYFAGAEEPVCVRTAGGSSHLQTLGQLIFDIRS